MISLVIATYNEEKNIERCLSSIKTFADEIIVVDGSSTDTTRELAKKQGAKVIKTTNKPNFHINKQMAMDAATGDLVLQIDADEVVDTELSTFIKEIDTNYSKSTNKKQWIEENAAAWFIPRKNLFLGSWLKKGGQYPDAVIRLYINGYARLPQKDVHEQMAVNGTTSWAKGHFLHYSNPTFNDYLRKFNTYTSFKADQLYKEKITISLTSAISYLIFKPWHTFLSLFLRHKGFVDGIAGFVFALFSGLHHAVAYLKLWEKYQERQND